jgi:uncharacterized protein YabE (DUF348 family)
MPSSSFWKILGVAFIAAALVVVAVYANQLDAEALYTIYDGDRRIQIKGNFETSEEVIASAGLTLNPDDKIEPSPAVSIAANQSIKISRADYVTLSIGGKSKLAPTHKPTLGDFLEEQNIAINDSTLIIADGVNVDLESLYLTNIPNRLEVKQQTLVTVVDGKDQITLFSGGKTIAAVLQDAGLIVGPHDSVTPPLDERIREGETIVIRRSLPVVVEADGKRISFETTGANVIGALSDSGVILVGKDYTIPAEYALINAGDLIKVIRVTEDFRYEDQSMPFDSVWQPTETLELDQRGTLVTGQTGILRRRYQIRYENDQLVSETLAGEWIAKEPVNEVIGYGTQVVVRTLETPSGSYEYWRKVRMRVTSYTASSSGKPPDHPAYGITASGITAGNGVVAVDPSIIPFRSWVYVPDYGIGFAGDTGGGVKGRWIDLGYDDGALRYWNGYVDVYYLTPVPTDDKINYLLPTNLP